MEKKGQTIYTYRYMWLTEASKEADKVNVRLITGVAEEHDAFIKTLQESDEVVNATRCYVCEYDVAQMDLYEKVKLVLGEDEEDKGEENETI